ncbi:MAG: aconitase X catalytic domain-containing protein [Desulfurococcales archaeon]|nr:aconitase X catalytic domain-containing protein [Desulfurococcales archaeon]
MYLTREEERMFDGYYGEAVSLAIRVIVKVGEALGAERLIRVKHVHVSGASYSTVGEAGRRFIVDLAGKGAKFRVYTTVNPVGMDTEDPNAIPYAIITREYIRGQNDIINAFKAMGADLILTCTPYYTYIPDKLGLSVGDHVAWGESSAVVYGNSVMGVRTNREGGPLALMAGITGRTYYYGMHIDSFRIPTIRYVARRKPLDEAEAGILGELIATIHDDEKPPLIEAVFTSDPALRELSAALGAAGSIAMAYIPGVTPEKPPQGRLESIELDEELKRVVEERAPNETPDIVFVGCPHASMSDLEMLKLEMKKYSGRPKSKILVSTSRHVYLEALSKGLVGELESMGVSFIRDSCLIVSPFARRGVKPVVATNSFKAYFYLRKRGVPVYIAGIPRLVRASYGG